MFDNSDVTCELIKRALNFISILYFYDKGFNMALPFVNTFAPCVFSNKIKDLG